MNRDPQFVIHQPSYRRRRRTLRADQDKGDLGSVAVLGHLGVIAVDGLEAGLALQAKDEDDRVHPGCELQSNKNKRERISQ